MSVLTCMHSGRNQPCPCGSRRRYKDCCGRLADGPSQQLAQLRALLDAGRYAELESAVSVLLGTDARSAALWQLLGIARARQNKDPLQAFGMAVRCAPHDAAAHLNLGNALARRGRLDEAASSYRRALEADSELLEAHNNLAELSLECGRLDEALRSGCEAVRIRPDLPATHQNLAKVLVRQGQFEDAARSCRRAIGMSPEYPEAHNTLGSALLGLGHTQQAIASLQRALHINPDFAEAHANLARAWRSLGRLDEAVAGYRRALQLKPDLILARTELATALRLQRRTDEAERTCQEVLKERPDYAAATLVLAELRADAGRFDEAEELFRRALAIEPQSAESWLGLTRVRRMTAADDASLAAMRRLVAQDLPPQQELLLRFAIGKHLDDIGYYGQAFRNYERANELAKRCGPQHDRAALSGTVDLIIRSCDAEWVKRQRAGLQRSARPVFIVGMLRSGTTLAEQILASHPQVHGAGELSFWSEVAAAALTRAPHEQPSALRMSDTVLAQLGERYLQMLRALSPDAVRVVDKLPTNFLFLGLIHAALPQARIIHLLRHPIDTCLSIYFQHFEAANTYTNDLEDLAHYYGEYRRLMQHWQAVLPEDTLLEVPYEGLVADLPRWTARMLEFIGVPWDARCLEFDRTPRPVVTASKWQVRQKLFRSSVGRWCRYEPFLSALAPLLEVPLSPIDSGVASLTGPGGGGMLSGKKSGLPAQ